MSAPYKIVKTSDAKLSTRKSPAAMILEAIGPGYETVASMAERYGVHVETIRRITKAVDEDGNPKVKAPSQAVQQGEMVIYLFTEEDVAEMDEYMAKRGRRVAKEEGDEDR